MKKNYLTVTEAAKICEVSTSAIYHWIKQKDYFKSKKVGGTIRIDKKSLLKYIKK